MFTKLRSATILVDDQDKALDFYVDVLGFERRIDYDMGPGFRFLTIGIPGDDREIVLGTESMNGTESIKNSLAFIVDDMDATYAELTAQGVTFRQEPEVFEWGGKGTWLIDPWDNALFLTSDPT